MLRRNGVSHRLMKSKSKRTAPPHPVRVRAGAAMPVRVVDRLKSRNNRNHRKNRKRSSCIANSGRRSRHVYPSFSKNIMSWIKQLEFKLLWPFYASYLIQSVFLLTTAYWVVYFLNIGYSLTQISLLPTIMLLTSLILELPTGFLADIKGRKRSVVTAIFLEASAIALIPFIGLRFEILIVLHILMGVGTALASGASEAWVVDFLHWHTKQKAIPSYYATLYSLINIGFIIAPILASAIFILTGALHYLWWIESIMIFGAGLILAVFGKEERAKQERSKLTITSLYQKTITQFRNHPILMLMAVVIFLFGIIFGVTTLTWQPFLQAKGIPLAWFGVLFAFSGILAIAYPIVQKTALTRIGSRRLLQFISIVQMIAFGVLITIPFVGIIILFFLLQNLDSIKIPIFQPWFQEHVPSALRSILGSVVAMAGAIGESVGYILAGQLAARFGFSVVWWSVAGLCAFTVIALMLTRRMNNKVPLPSNMVLK